MNQLIGIAAAAAWIINGRRHLWIGHLALLGVWCWQVGVLLVLLLVALSCYPNDQ
jgi:hypothetical protein